MWPGRTTYGNIDGLGRPSMAAILAPGGPPVAINIVWGALFWGDHQWHVSPELSALTICEIGSSAQTIHYIIYPWYL